MVTSRASTNSIYQAQDSIYSGVVKVSSNGYYGTGTLLYDGSTILTAAHLFDEDSSQAGVRFELGNGVFVNLDTSHVLLHPEYDPVSNNNDLALVFLEEFAPIEASRYDIYRESDEVDKIFLATGYGLSGEGSLGYDENSEITRLMSYNSFDIVADEFKSQVGTMIGWYPNENVLVADFDDGFLIHDALGTLVDIYDVGLGQYEGIIAPGDSGGPGFIDWKVAGVASYSSSLNFFDLGIDIDDEVNSSFGELGFWQRVSGFDEWIDKNVRENYTNSPTSKEEVILEVLEGDLGENPIVYFFVELLNAPNNRDEDTYSIDYTTRDGSAVAYEDYVPISGTLKIYDNENYAVIPVELISDNMSEDDETFFLDISNPVGGVLLGGVTTLSASRTIIDDDLLV